MAEPHFVEANGLRFAYFTEGDGPLALLLHGFPDTPHTWSHLRPALVARGYRVVAPFMRGYSPTGIPQRDTDMETLARDVLALIEAVGEKRALVIGHDWGAIAAYGATALGPDRVEKLVTIAIPHPAAWKRRPGRMWAARHFVENKLPGAAARFARNDFAALRALYQRWSPTWDVPPAELDAARACFADRRSLDAAFGYYRTLPLVTGIAAFLRTKIAVPTIAFSGLDDPMARPPDYEEARTMFTGSYVVETMPGGHFMHREHPDELARRLFGHLP